MSTDSSIPQRGEGCAPQGLVSPVSPYGAADHGRRSKIALGQLEAACGPEVRRRAALHRSANPGGRGTSGARCAFLSWVNGAGRRASRVAVSPGASVRNPACHTNGLAHPDDTPSQISATTSRNPPFPFKLSMQPDPAVGGWVDWGWSAWAHRIRPAPYP